MYICKYIFAVTDVTNHVGNGTSRVVVGLSRDTAELDTHNTCFMCLGYRRMLSMQVIRKCLYDSTLRNFENGKSCNASLIINITLCYKFIEYFLFMANSRDVAPISPHFSLYTAGCTFTLKYSKRVI